MPTASRLSRRLDLQSIRARLRRWSPERPGQAQRLRARIATLLAAAALLLRPWPPFQWLPGWCVGGLLIWAVLETALWQWWPRRWR